MARILLPFLLVMVAACGHGRTYEPVEAESRGSKIRITGPYAYENLAVYLIHSASGDDRDFITLDEGLKDGSVTVSEKDADGQVNELLLENNNAKPLFIQEGDRVKGGKQDRIVGLSFIVPAKSGKTPIPSFCIEQGRWHDAGGAGFTVASRPLAPKDVRAAAKGGKDQQEVWQQVAENKAEVRGALSLEATNTSLNEAMDSEKTKKAMEPYEKYLSEVVRSNPDAVGVAFALNGKVEEVDLYPGHKLLAKLYPRLLGSYAMTAALKREAGTFPTPADVAAFMKEGREKSSRSESVAENSVTIRDLDSNFHCVTQYQGKSVHDQWMRKEENRAPAAGRDGQQSQQLEEQNAAPRRR